jgi:hypothetical protein
VHPQLAGGRVGTQRDGLPGGQRPDERAVGLIRLGHQMVGHACSPVLHFNVGNDRVNPKLRPISNRALIHNQPA